MLNILLAQNDTENSRNNCLIIETPNCLNVIVSSDNPFTISLLERNFDDNYNYTIEDFAFISSLFGENCKFKKGDIVQYFFFKNKTGRTIVAISHIKRYLAKRVLKNRSYDNLLFDCMGDCKSFYKNVDLYLVELDTKKSFKYSTLADYYTNKSEINYW